MICQKKVFMIWIYGKCNNIIDTQDIDHLIEFENFTESACIRKYYNKENKKYYHTNDINFVWPNLINGCWSLKKILNKNLKPDIYLLKMNN